MRILAAAILLALAPATLSVAQAQPSPPVSITDEGIAIGGYDAVSYFVKVGRS